jgi:hypothetical protein
LNKKPGVWFVRPDGEFHQSRRHEAGLATQLAAGGTPTYLTWVGPRPTDDRHSTPSSTNERSLIRPSVSRVTTTVMTLRPCIRSAHHDVVQRSRRGSCPGRSRTKSHKTASTDVESRTGLPDHAVLFRALWAQIAAIIGLSPNSGPIGRRGTDSQMRGAATKCVVERPASDMAGDSPECSRRDPR